MERLSWKWRLAVAVAVGSLLVGWLAAAADFSAVTSVAETRSFALAMLIVSAILFGLWLFRRRSAAAAVGAVVGVAGIAFTVYLLFFAYAEREVSFRSDGVALRGTLYGPRGKAPEGGIVFVHGSGASTRDFFRWHAKHYARNGVAALIYDKRGAGRSEGNTWTATYHDYAADSVAAVRFLRESTGLPEGVVGLFGHSEGGWVVPIAASMIEGGPAFLIVSSTTPMTPAEQVLYETRASVQRGGFDAETIDRAVALQMRVLDYQRTGRHDPDLERALKSAGEEAWFAPAKLPRTLYPAEEYAWWRSVMDFNVRPYWARIDEPVLAISGGLDRNSDVRVSQEEIRRQLREGGNDRFTGVIYPRMEHGMVEWWLPGRLPPPRFPKELPELLIRWVRDQTS